VVDELESPIEGLTFPEDPLRDRDDHREVRMTDGSKEVVVARIPAEQLENPSGSGQTGVGV
jgi:hypothetical protein